MQLKKLANLIFVAVFLAACGLSATEVPTTTPAPTATPTAIPTDTPTPIPTETPTATPVPTNTLRPTATPTPVPQPGDVLLSDSFNDNANNWTTFADAHAIVKVDDGVFSMQVKDRNVFYYSNPAKRLTDVDVTVDMTLVDGASSNTLMGGQCRRRDDNHYYLFAISGDGSYTIAKFSNEGWKPLSDWARSSALRTGKATNTVRFICVGDTLQLWINGVRLATVHDDEYTAGSIGLIAGTFDGNDPNSTVTFDNLAVSFPEPIEIAASGGGGGAAATSPASTGGGGQTVQPTPSGNGQLIIVMCQELETTVTIFKDGQIIQQHSLHRAGTNTYDLPPGHYDVQFNTAGYYNLNLSYDITPGSVFTQYIGHSSC